MMVMREGKSGCVRHTSMAGASAAKWTTRSLLLSGATTAPESVRTHGLMTDNESMVKTVTESSALYTL